MSLRVAVVGGGPAGLTAAHRLLAEGVVPTVLEARPWIGGRMRTDDVDGYHIDTYTQVFGSIHTEIVRLIEAVGARSLVADIPGRDALWRNGRAHEIVYGSIASMLGTGAVPMATKLLLGTRYLRFLDRHGGDLEIHAAERAAAAGLDAESIAAWGRRELNDDFVELLAYPLLASCTGTSPEETSAAIYHIFARAGTDVTMHALRGGMGRLTDRVAAAIRDGGGEIRTGAEVRRVEAAGKGVEVAGEGWAERFDGAVVCVPGVEVPLIVPGLSAEGRRWFEGVRYQPLASLALLLDAPVGVRYFGLSYPRRESRVVSSICVEENKNADVVPAGRGMLVVFPAPEAVALFQEAEPERVVAAALPDLERVFPGLRGRVRRVKLYRWPVGGPLFYPGYLGHLATFARGAVEAGGPIAFGGDYLTFPSAEGSVLSGRRAAERLLRRLGD